MEQLLLSNFQLLPEHLKAEVVHFAEFLASRAKNSTFLSAKKGRKAGSAKGKYVLSADFDAPLEDFKDYM